MNSSPSLEDYWNVYKELTKTVDITHQEMKTVSTLFTHIKQAYENFGNALRIMGENFHRDISKDNKSNDRYFSYYQYLGNYLLKIGAANKELARRIETVILVPYNEFGSNLQKVNIEKIEKTKKNLLNIEQNKQNLKKSQDNFYKLSRTAEKQQETFEKVALDESKSEETLQKTQDKTVKLKIEAQEAGNLYRKQINSTNGAWKTMYTEYRQPFDTFDDNEENRLAFTQNTITNLLKFFNGFYGSKEYNITENHEEKFKEFNEKPLEKTETFKSIVPNTLETNLNEQPLEEYISYETKKKIDEEKLQKAIEAEELQAIYQASNPQDLQFISKFSKNFTGSGSKSGRLSISSPEKRGRSSSNSNAEPDTSISTTSEESANKSTEIKKGDPEVITFEDNDKKFWQTMNLAVNRKFFFDRLSKIRDPTREDNIVKLTPRTFETLLAILTKLLEIMIKERDFENLFNMLGILTKFYTKKENQVEYLYKAFRAQEIWEDVKVWQGLLKISYEKKINDEQLRIKKAAALGIEQNPSSVTKIFSFGMTKISGILDMGKSKSFDKDNYLTAVFDMTPFLGRLTKNIVISSELLIEISLDAGFDKRDIEDLIFSQKKEIDDIIRQRVNAFSGTKKNKAQKKWGKNFPIYLALEYLAPKDLVNLLALDRNTRSMFKNKIYKTIFKTYGDKLQQQQRFSIWYNLLEINKLDLDYEDLAKRFMDAKAEKPGKNIDDVIEIDVQRSFNNHQNCDPLILKNLLRAYAVYDKEVQYCQGMNYMMGFLYIVTQDPQKSFRVFCKMMEKLRHLFDHEFKQLKKYFFKFTRLVELFMPDLAEHFKKEKVESSFYIAPWFITVFANSFQYSNQSSFLEKIWDFFLMDGVKSVFRVGILILMQYKDKLMELKFDAILNFLGDLGRDELFKNLKYFEVKQGLSPVESATVEFKFISEFSKRYSNLHITNQLLQLLDSDFDVFETRLVKLFKPPQKK